MTYLYLGNHFYNVATQDMWEYVHNGLKEVGVNSRYSFTDISTVGTNIFLENFTPELTNALIDFKKNNPSCKIYIIVTETIVEGTFNSANVAKGTDASVTSHYDNFPMWKSRYDNFYKLSKIASGLIAVSELLYENYTKANLGVPIFYLPMTALPTYVPILQAPDSEKDIDIYFTGSMTEYRSNMISRFKNLGLRVFEAPQQLPEYLRRHMLGRSRLAIGPKLEESTHILSKCRAHYYLTMQAPHLFEAVSDKTDLDPYLEFSATSDIVAEANSLLKSEIHFDYKKLELFKHNLPYEDTFSSLKIFLKN